MVFAILARAIPSIIKAIPSVIRAAPKVVTAIPKVVQTVTKAATFAAIGTAVTGFLTGSPSTRETLGKVVNPVTVFKGAKSGGQSFENFLNPASPGEGLMSSEVLMNTVEENEAARRADIAKNIVLGAGAAGVIAAGVAVVPKIIDKIKDKETPTFPTSSEIPDSPASPVLQPSKEGMGAAAPSGMQTTDIYKPRRRKAKKSSQRGQGQTIKQSVMVQVGVNAANRKYLNRIVYNK